MKKLMRKLVLSSFALGLAVITLSTTTFAWYTSNKDVTASNIGGTTADAGAELLMITQETNGAGTPINFNTSVEVNQSGEQTLMVPLSRTSFGVYNELGAPTDGTVKDNVPRNGYISFTLYFKNASPKEANLYIQTMTLTNTTGKKYDPATKTWSGTTKLPDKDVLTAGREHLLGTGTASTYKIDVLRTLMMDVRSTQYVSTDGSVPTKGTEIATTLYNLEGIAELNTDSFIKGTSNAHEYYNAIMDENLTKTTQDVYDSETAVFPIGNPYGASAAMAINELPVAGDANHANSYLKVEFIIFINGWDLACFDACQGQSFNLNMTFTTIDTAALRTMPSVANEAFTTVTPGTGE